MSQLKKQLTYSQLLKENEYLNSVIKVMQETIRTALNTNDLLLQALHKINRR